MAEEREEEEEARVEKASQLPPFLADFPAILGMVRVDQKLRSRRWTR